MNKSTNNNYTGYEIAIIGMSGRFPEANTVHKLWENLKNGKESVSFFTDEELLEAGNDPEIIKNPDYVKARCIIDQPEFFDAAFFDYSPRDAEILDPQQRLFLESAYEALEDACYASDTHNYSIGVFGSISLGSYMYNLFLNPAVKKKTDEYSIIVSNDKDFLATRVAYKLNLKGPCLTVQTACSSSLVAVHVACQSLLSGECDIALSGGVRIVFPHISGYLYIKEGIMSPDGHCRAFDANARGTISGSGAGVIVLKRLEDAMADRDHIYAVIKGSAINNDGALKAGYTAPAQNGQAAVIKMAHAMADISPDTISYIEAHGTGTILGDPIEIAALSDAFDSAKIKKEYCSIGSIKPNIGHLDAAAGIAGLIKTALSLYHKQIPPSINFKELNPKINLDNTPFYINVKLKEWSIDDGVRRAGVSSFGIGGTNAHIVLEEAPQITPSRKSRSHQLLFFSAKTISALEKMTDNLVEYCKENPNTTIADIAFSINTGRKHLKHHRMTVCSDLNDLINTLEIRNPKRVLTYFGESRNKSVYFMFPGQGSQYRKMAYELYISEPYFTESVDYCCEFIKKQYNIDIFNLIYDEADIANKSNGNQINKTAFTQPALFIIEYALAKLLIKWGIRPHGMIGHGVGEYVCACISGVLKIEDALKLMTIRGRLMQELPSGEMVAIHLSAQQINPYLNKFVSIAAKNTPALTVISGSTGSIREIKQKLEDDGVTVSQLPVSHAFHSYMMEPIKEKFYDAIKELTFHSPQIPYISNYTGTWITDNEIMDPEYWYNHLRNTVNFTEGIKELLNDQEGIFLEVGPGRTLSSCVGRHPSRRKTQFVLTTMKSPKDTDNDQMFFLDTIGRYLLSGGKINWHSFYSDETRVRISLPSYPFERQRFWIERPQDYNETGNQNEKAVNNNQAEDTGNLGLHDRPNLSQPFAEPRNAFEQTITEIWKESLGIKSIGIYDNFFELGGHSLLATRIISRLREKFNTEISLMAFMDAGSIAELGMEIIESLCSTESEEEIHRLIEEVKNGV
ncbi:MAG: acyltransferase domain-containing protein [Spirochaetales bacterium]|nr:acyltransferase domain-containing protein [Spirochaetales bacterium]